MRAIALILVSFMSLGAWAVGTQEQPDRNDRIYNLTGAVGLKGYDPVSYFPEGGSQPQMGNMNFAGQYGNVVYYFASEAHRQMFFAEPTKYEPTYGGWCAWAMANQSYADIDPMLFTLNGRRLHFFISRGAKARFDRDLINRETAADNFWRSESGEMPRF
ncbi:MAG: hypothetical protein KDD61_03970 [Bdellovibrionales bacterium]|nr:hypothetical protein [Bdellovibrionales bacterium]